MKSIEVWAVIVFVCQIALLIANPPEFWVKWIPVEIVVIMVFLFGVAGLIGVIGVYSDHLRERRKLLKIPEKEE
jgi:hypothetical protein